LPIGGHAVGTGPNHLRPPERADPDGDEILDDQDVVRAAPMTARRRVTQAVVRQLALSFPEAVEGSHFDRADFRVRNRIFATLPPDGRIVVLKMSPPNVNALVASDAETFRDEWRGRWLGVQLGRIAEPVLRDLMDDAWRLVAPKRLAAAHPPRS
jgi:hypothetical protein